jgi:hypothetical protein
MGVKRFNVNCRGSNGRDFTISSQFHCGTACEWVYSGMFIRRPLIRRTGKRAWVYSGRMREYRGRMRHKTGRRNGKILLLVACLAAPPATAQQTSWDYIGGGFGGSDFHLRDDHASPLIFSGWEIAPSVQYLHAGERNRQYAEASYSSALLATSQDNFRTENWCGRVRYAYLVSIADPGNSDTPLRLFVGGSVGSFLSRSDYYYFVRPLNGYSTSIDSWYWSTSLDAAAHLEYGIAEREFLSLQCYVPLLSNVARPQYSPSGDYSYTRNVFVMKMFGRTEVFPKNISCDMVVACQVPLFWRFNVQLSYEFFFASYDLPGEMKMYMNIARGGVFFCF